MSQQPLLSSERPSSEQSDENASVEDALLTGERTGRGDLRDRRKYGWPFWREVGLFVWAMIATAAVVIIGVLYEHQLSKGETPPPSGKRNLIFMVSDGMGPTSLSLTRSFRQYQLGLPPDDVLVLDRHHIGTSRTRSTSSLVTDSAAGATAFSCGLKTYNNAIALLPDYTPCGTVLEAAKAAGYMTGLVVTTRITDATPACFAAHVHSRWEEDRIAEQEVGDYPLGRVVDLMLGGGRCHFLPNFTDGSCRKDGKDVIALAKKNGFNYISDREGFDRLKLGHAAALPLLGLFAETDIPFEVDRRYLESTYPSLDEMARTALRALTEATRDSDKGFFLMIEGSRIDHAGHGNDPVAQVHEVLAYDKAFASALKFIEDSKLDGVVVSTSDHETGGLAAARRKFVLYYTYLAELAELPLFVQSGLWPRSEPFQRHYLRALNSLISCRTASSVS
jgi:alkaline phosphatase